MNQKIPYIVALMAIGWAIMSTQKCTDNKKALTELSNYDSKKNDTVQTLKAKNGQLIKYVDQTQANYLSARAILDENADLKEELNNMKVKLSKVQQVSQIVNHISPPKQDTIVVPITYLVDTSMPCPQKHDTAKFSDITKYYTIKGAVTPKSVEFTKIDFPDTITTVSENVGSIFKDIYALKITHSNPYINTTGIQSLVIKPDKMWYQTTVFKLAVGFVAGIYVETKLK